MTCCLRQLSSHSACIDTIAVLLKSCWLNMIYGMMIVNLETQWGNGEGKTEGEIRERERASMRKCKRDERRSQDSARAATRNVCLDEGGGLGHLNICMLRVCVRTNPVSTHDARDDNSCCTCTTIRITNKRQYTHTHKYAKL